MKSMSWLIASTHGAFLRSRYGATSSMQASEHASILLPFASRPGTRQLRLNTGPGYRIYFGRDGGTVILLLGGGTKRHQDHDIEAAKALWREYKSVKRGVRA